MDNVSLAATIVGGLAIVWLTMPEVRLQAGLLWDQATGKSKSLYEKTTAVGLKVKHEGLVRKIKKHGGTGLKEYVILEDDLRLQPFNIELKSYSTGKFEDLRVLLLDPSEAVFVYDGSPSKLNDVSRVWSDDTKIGGDWASVSDNKQVALNDLDSYGDIAAKMLKISGLNKKGGRDVE